MLTWGQFAGLVVAFAWAVLVGFLAYVLIRLARVLSETTRLVAGISDRTAPLLDEMTTTVTRTNDQLERVDVITRNVQTVSDNVSGLSSIIATAFGGPLVRVAAFSYGVRRAISGRRPGEPAPARRRGNGGTPAALGRRRRTGRRLAA